MGISSDSIADGSINRSRTATGAGSGSVTISAGSDGGATLDSYTFAPSIFAGTSIQLMVPNFSGTGLATFQAHNQTGSSVTVSYNYRSFTP